MPLLPGSPLHAGLSRRDLLKTAAGAAAGCAASCAVPLAAQEPSVQTVTGAVPAGRLGLTLMHEHVLVDFVGAAQVSRSRYDADEAFRTILPHLAQVRSLGCDTLVECTPAYLGRDPQLLRRLAEASGLHILTNTGYYGAANDRHLPPHAFTETPDALAARWIREYEYGIEGTGIRPAFMKVGVDGAPLSAVDASIVRAAGIAHKATGLGIHSHTGSGAAAMEQLDRLQEAGVPASAFVWVHAQSEKDVAFHVRTARRGAWVEFDGISDTSVDRHVALVVSMKAEGLLGRVLVSHDAGWYRVGEPGGGRFRPYDTLFTAFRPAAARAGVTEAELRDLLVTNPRRALTTGAERGTGRAAALRSPEELER